MNVVVFGANGRVGRRAVRLALDQGHIVTAFVRRADEAARVFASSASDGSLPANLRITRGNVLAAGEVFEAMRNQDAVVSALGVRGFESSGAVADVPGGAGADEPGGTMLDAIGNVVSAMIAHGVTRIVTVAVSGILPQAEPSNGLIRDLPEYPKVFASSSKIHLAVHDLLMQSDLDWTIVCPGHMPEGDPSGDYIVSAEARPVSGQTPAMFSREKGGIATGDVAQFIVIQLTSPAYSRKRVGIAPILRAEPSL